MSNVNIAIEKGHPRFQFTSSQGIQSSDEAQQLAVDMHRLVAGVLNEIGGEKADELRVWSAKKAVGHTAEVVKVAKDLVDSDTFATWFKERGIDQSEIMETMLINAWTHDLGRQSQINFDNLISVSDKVIDHSTESFNILQDAGVVDAGLLLPVKYHGMFAYDKAIMEDPLFQSLSDENKEYIIRMTDGLRDADKAANLMSKAKHGMKGVGEMTNPKYKADYDITPETLQGLVDGTGCDQGWESHRLDAMLRWLSWGDQFVNKSPSITKLINDLWDRTFEHAQTEFDNCNEQDIERFENTISSLRAAREAQMERLRLTDEQELLHTKS